MSKNDNLTSGILVGLVQRKTAYFLLSHKLHWLCIFQTSEWHIVTSDFHNPFAWWTSAFNLNFRSLYQVTILHLLQQVSHRGMCINETWSDHCFSGRSNINFTWFGSRAHKHFMKWVPRNIFWVKFMDNSVQRNLSIFCNHFLQQIF